MNLNTATSDQLQLLPGVGPAKAERVLAYRRLRPFRTVEELVRVKGIGPRSLRALRPHLTVRGATTARLVNVPAAPLAAGEAAPAGRRPVSGPARAPAAP